jgi:DNA-binding GntR family transcriptional regulator
MTEKRFAAFHTATLADQVYEHLLRQISTGIYLPGHPLRELDLVQQFGVSRTPIREALLRLTEYGLLEMAGRSARVRRLSVDDVRHVFQVRCLLEGEAVKRACGRMLDGDLDRLESLAPRDLDPKSPGFDAACLDSDFELHRLIADRCGNPILAQEIRKLHDLVQLIYKASADRAGRLAESAREHSAIIAALKAGDWRASRKAMRDHLRAAYRTWVRGVRATAALTDA